MIHEALQKGLSREEIEKSPEYQTKLRNATEDAIKFATRVKAVVERQTSPTEGELEQLRSEYAKISESALIAHDSIPDSVNFAKSEKGNDFKIKGRDGLFLGHIRVEMLKALGDGDDSKQTPARKLFQSHIYNWDKGLYSERERIY